MTTKTDFSKVDEKIMKIYENQITTNVSPSTGTFIDRSDLLLNQMTFIALNNKSFLNLK